MMQYKLNVLHRTRSSFYFSDSRIIRSEEYSKLECVKLSTNLTLPSVYHISFPTSLWRKRAGTSPDCNQTSNPAQPQAWSTAKEQNRGLLWTNLISSSWWHMLVQHTGYWIALSKVSRRVSITHTHTHLAFMEGVFKFIFNLDVHHSIKSKRRSQTLHSYASKKQRLLLLPVLHFDYRKDTTMPLCCMICLRPRWNWSAFCGKNIA